MTGNKKRGSAAGGAKAAVWGLSILALVLGFTLAGCDNGSKPTITAAATLKAIAVKDGITDSDVLTAANTIDPASGGNDIT
jgi:hypothetical protein